MPPQIAKWDALNIRLTVHWEQVELVIGPLTLSGGFTRTNFLTLADKFRSLESAIPGYDNAVTNAIGDREILRAKMIERVKQFRRIVMALLPTSARGVRLPEVPSPTASAEVTLAAFRAVEHRWALINANNPPEPDFTPPLFLAGNYSLADFSGDIAQFAAIAASLGSARLDARMARRRRDETLAELRMRIKQYRFAVAASLAAPHPLLQSIPRSPGS